MPQRHYMPSTQYRQRYAEVRRHWLSLKEAVQGWVYAIAKGNWAPGVKRAPFPALRYEDEVLSAIKLALTEAREWDGFQIGHALKLHGWPVNFELAQIIHEWSCALAARLNPQPQS